MWSRDSILQANKTNAARTMTNTINCVPFQEPFAVHSVRFLKNFFKPFRKDRLRFVFSIIAERLFYP